MLVDGEPEWEVERVVGHRETRRGTRYTVRFRGYGPEEDLGLHSEDLGNCWDLVEQYCTEHGLPLPAGT